jgi:Transcription termination factor nusG
MMKLPDAFSPEVMRELARPVLTFDPRDAEIVAGVSPSWYVIEVYSDRKVAEELVKRRFGVFVPESEQTIIRRGRKIDLKQLMFPGYIFVFVWGMPAHWSRIGCIPGVLGVLGTISDDKIDEIRAVENGERPLRISKKKRRHRGKRAYDDDVVGVHAWSAFQDRLVTLDSEGRNQTLRDALCLCS